MTDQLDQPTIDYPTPDRMRAPSSHHSHIEVVREDRGDGPVVVKTATGRARSQLRREAQLLEQISTPGVVTLIGFVDEDDRSELVLIDAGARTLADPRDERPETTLRALQRCAEAVAALHREGWSHGALCAEHVVVSARGSARLCSLGSARPLVGGGETARDDVVQLIDLVDGVASARTAWSAGPRRGRLRTDRRLRHLVDSWRRAGAVVDADRIARELHDLRRSRNGRRVRSDGDLDRPDPRFARPLVVGVAVAGVIATAGLVLSYRSDPMPTAAARPSPPTSTTAPAMTTPATSATTPPPAAQRCPAGLDDIDGDGCDDTVVEAHNTVKVNDVTYRLGETGDSVVVGDWNCDGISTPLLLRASSGQIYHFDGWATAETPSSGSEVRSEAEGIALVRADDPDQPGCDVAQMVRQDGSAGPL